MQIDEKIKKEIIDAINNRKEDSFEFVASGGLPHFISSEGEERGLFLTSLTIEEKEFKVYMI